MSFTIRRIRISLDPASIQNAIDQVEEIRDRLKPALDSLVGQMAEKGVEIARAELIFFSPPAYFTGELSDSIQSESTGGSGRVYTGCEYAAYVEFGTGAVGEGSNTNPDTTGPFRQSGWAYFNERDGKWHWTTGMAARPFMYNTLRDLEAYVEDNGGRIIADYLA